MYIVTCHANTCLQVSRASEIDSFVEKLHVQIKTQSTRPNIASPAKLVVGMKKFILPLTII